MNVVEREGGREILECTIHPRMHRCCDRATALSTDLSQRRTARNIVWPTITSSVDKCFYTVDKCLYTVDKCLYTVDKT